MSRGTETVVIRYWVERSNKGWHAVVDHGQGYPGWLNSRALDKDEAMNLARESAIEYAETKFSGDWDIQIVEGTEADAEANERRWRHGRRS